MTRVTGPPQPPEALFAAVRQNQLAAAEELLRQGASVEQADANGETVLYYACLLGLSDMAQLLVDHGARDDPQRRCYHNALDKSALPAALRNRSHKTHPQAHPPPPRPPPEGEAKPQLQQLLERRDRHTTQMLQSAKKREERTHIFLKCMKWTRRWEEFFDDLADNPVPQYLDIRKCRMGPSATAAMAGCLRRNCHLTEIFMYKNEVGDQGVAALCHALADNRYLTKLNLCDNLITARGAQSFAELLRQPGCVLVQLDLNRNAVGDGGVAHIAAALHSNSVLCVLSLRENGITDVGAECVQAALQHNTTVELFYLQQNAVSSTLFDSITESCTANFRRKGYVFDHRERCAELCSRMLYGPNASADGRLYLPGGPLGEGATDPPSEPPPT